MSLVPLEITSKEFHKTMRGYDPMEVKSFLEEVSRELGRALSDKSAIAAELNAVKDNLAKYHELEDAIKETLLLAQRTREEVVESAKKQAELIIEEARHQGRKIEERYATLKATKREFEIEFDALISAFHGKLKELHEPEDKRDAAHDAD
ncbi:MAG: DivIVA domain-containing protein [bacterium]